MNTKETVELTHGCLGRLLLEYSLEAAKTG